MGRDFAGDQQLVRGKRANWRLAALPLMLMALSAAFVFVTQCTVNERARSESEEEGELLRDEVTGGACADGGSSVEASLEGLVASLAPVKSEHVRASSLGGFLDDLRAWQKEASRSGDEPCASVEFEDRASLPVLAEDVLKAYARTGTASLVASGYLDLKGNVWGAVLRDGAAWCDVLLITTEDDSVSRVRVTRVLPER